MENLSYLLAAYSVVWAVLFCFVFVLSRRQKQLQRELDDLKKKMAGKGEAH